VRLTHEFFFLYNETCIETQNILVTSIFIGSLPDAVRFFLGQAVRVTHVYIEPAT
jgi:hypothetical protein